MVLFFWEIWLSDFSNLKNLTLVRRIVVWRNELFATLLQQYFQNRGWWYEGAKISPQPKKP